jgi:hypothetical protein
MRPRRSTAGYDASFYALPGELFADLVVRGDRLVAETEGGVLAAQVLGHDRDTGIQLLRIPARRTFGTHHQAAADLLENAACGTRNRRNAKRFNGRVEASDSKYLQQERDGRDDPQAATGHAGTHPIHGGATAEHQDL